MKLFISTINEKVLKMENVNDDDLMSKVMNRRLGGRTSSCESSPVKQHLVSSEKYANLWSGYGSCNPNNRSSVASLTKSEHQQDLADIDEIDGFTEDKVENVNEKDVEYDRYDTKSFSKSNIQDIADAAGSKFTDVQTENDKDHGHGESYAISEEDLDHHPENYEYVLASEDVKDNAEPRIEIFNESDSNSNSNPFILSSFQSLNASSNVYSPETNDESMTAEDDTSHLSMEIDNNSKCSAESSEEFGGKKAEQYNDRSQISSQSVYKENEDTVESANSDESENGIKKSEIARSDNSVVEFRNVTELKKESQSVNNLRLVLQIEGSDIENGSDCLNQDSDEFAIGKSENKISPVFGIEESNSKESDKDIVEIRMTDKDCKEINNVSWNNKDVDLCNRNQIKKDTFEKSVAKKSRKQNVPKRVRKVESSIENCGACSEEKMDIGKNVFKIEEVTSSVQETVDEVALRENDELPKYEEAEQKKSEKTRKQYKPKRINQLQNLNVEASVLDNESDETESFEMVSDITDDTEMKYNYMIDNDYFEMQKDKGKDMKNSSESDCEVTLSSRQADSIVIPVKSSESLDKSCESSVMENESERETSSAYSLQNTPDKGSINHFTSLSSNPFYYGFSPDLNLISSLTPGMLQGGSSCPGGFALDENGPENLEVIRQLREIRCNRYRKISIAEKREISAYANAHGVSQAASYYNVSKSAVSMWTKLDFSNADEDSGIKRKNCMSGNEKFEALCRKVKNERESKFKGMTKQDKFEVSRYAKLVGVREMSRCLGVALGTVSGWMRQFPYKVETDSQDESNSKNINETKDDSKKSETAKVDAHNGKSINKRKSEQNSKSSKKQKKSESVTFDSDSFLTVQKDDTMYILPVDEIETVEKDQSITDSYIKDNDETVKKSAAENDPDSYLEQKDELDKMIAETWQKPDVEKCFEDVKEMIKDSPLEGDDFFRSLFDRVIACRADKYKTLKPSEKLEVVRYAKRIGVRRVAKIMGLATGTLSGWNTKYQSSLGITDPSLDMSNKTDLLVSYLSPDKSVESESVTVTPGALMDGEKSEVTAVKLLFKDRFPTLVKKIEIAKQVKFRNITTDEKIEFVKCSKLVGIRPTARVFGIPIGTLSGWISKYSKLLHPAYHVEVDQETTSNSLEYALQNPHTVVSSSNLVGRNAALHGGMISNPGWQPVPGFLPGGQGSGLNLFPQLPSLSSSVLSASSFSSSEIFSPVSSTSETVSPENSSDTANGIQHMTTSQSKICNDNQSGNLHKKGNISESQIENQATSSFIKTEPKEFETQSTCVDDFEKEAKVMAEQYLTAAYKKMGIPIG